MKFGKQLKAYALTEWAPFYVEYKSLKDQLKKATSEHRLQSQPRHLRSSDKLWKGLLNRSGGGSRRTSRTTDARELPLLEGDEENDGGEPLHEEIEDQVTEYDLFISMLDSEVDRVNVFWTKELAVTEELLAEISSAIEALNDPPSEGDRRDREEQLQLWKERYQKSLCGLSYTLEELQAYSNLNYMAFYKILKKGDKALGTAALVEKLNVIKQQPFRQFQGIQTMQDRISVLYGRVADDPDVNMYKVQRDIHGEFLRHQPQKNQLYFFLGACTVLLLDIVIMCLIPASNPLYTTSELLAPFPIFRLSFMLIALMWISGFCMHVFEAHRVNYKFMLNVDPKCTVGPSTFLTIASIQTLVWIGCFGLYVADYKFLLFGAHDMYWLYPLACFFLEFGVYLLPSATFRRKYRTQILKCVALVFAACICPTITVSFCQNIVGDMLTSLAKPLADLEYTVCYLSTGIGNPKPANCGPWDHWTRPFIIALPYYIRCMQCFSRLLEAMSTRGSKKGDSTMGKQEYMHIANMLKYVSGLVVVITTSLQWDSFGVSLYLSRLFWVLSYTVATIFMFLWDVLVDWGLAKHPDNYLRDAKHRMYPDYFYIGISIFNLMGRLTWAMTLMPIEILEDKLLNANLITFGISIIEIVRRGLWALIRLENEHLNNSSRYRAMLWVPPLRTNEKEVSNVIASGRKSDLIRGRRLSSPALNSLGPVSLCSPSAPNRANTCMSSGFTSAANL